MDRNVEALMMSSLIEEERNFLLPLRGCHVITFWLCPSFTNMSRIVPRPSVDTLLRNQEAQA
jgi:hypothetical protein